MINIIREDKGFGFVEMIIVLLIIGAISYYLFLKPTEKEDIRKAQEIVHDTEDRTKANLNLGVLRTQIKVYHMEKGKYPESLDVIAKNETLKNNDVDISRYHYDPDTGEVSLK